MILRKDLIFAVLTTVCLTSILFLAIPIISTPTTGGYDPWIDTNDDGIINYQDLYNFAVVYGTSGTPINKTDLLLELQTKMDNLNASLVALLSRVEALEAPESVTTEKIADDAVTTDKIADYAVTNDELAAGAIPYNCTHKAGLEDSTTSTTWEDMPYMSVDITLYRTSYLMIMLSCSARNTDPSHRIDVQALVDGIVASPSWVYLIPEDTVTSGSYTRIFCKSSVSAGDYTIKIQWRVAGGTGYVSARSLCVIALPA